VCVPHLSLTAQEEEKGEIGRFFRRPCCLRRPWTCPWPCWQLYSRGDFGQREDDPKINAGEETSPSFSSIPSVCGLIRNSIYVTSAAVCAPSLAPSLAGSSAGLTAILAVLQWCLCSPNNRGIPNSSSSADPLRLRGDLAPSAFLPNLTALLLQIRTRGGMESASSG